MKAICFGAALYWEHCSIYGMEVSPCSVLGEFFKALAWRGLCNVEKRNFTQTDPKSRFTISKYHLVIWVREGNTWLHFAHAIPTPSLQTVAHRKRSLNATGQCISWLLPTDVGGDYVSSGDSVPHMANYVQTTSDSALYWNILLQRALISHYVGKRNSGLTSLRHRIPNWLLPCYEARRPVASGLFVWHWDAFNKAARRVVNMIPLLCRSYWNYVHIHAYNLCKQIRAQIHRAKVAKHNEIMLNRIWLLLSLVRFH